MVGINWFASVLKVPLGMQLQNKTLWRCIVPPYLNYPTRLTPISCKLPESGTEDNPTVTGKRVHKNKDRMEDYNVAMKRMMRNPYEYHHDLGLFHLFTLFIPSICYQCFLSSFCSFKCYPSFL